MFCTKCGHKNAEGAAFCVSCGSALANVNNTVQPAPASPPQGAYVPPPPVSNPPVGYAGYAPPKKSRKGLIIGLCVGGAVLIAAAIVLIVLFAGGKPIVGEWYCDERGEVIEFNKDGTVEISGPNGDFEGEYIYNKGKGEGVITIEGDEIDFAVDNDELDVDDIGVYAREGSEAAKSRSIIGYWYCENRDETITFAKDGYVEIDTPEDYYSGEYTYNEGKGKGVITIDGDDYSFSVDEDELEVRDEVYVKGAGGSGVSYDNGVANDEKPEKTDKPDSFGEQKGIIGLWYETLGLAGSVEIYANGTFEMSTMGIAVSGTYDFDVVSGEGEMTLDYAGETDTVDIYFENGTLFLDGLEYTREYVEQMNMEDFLEDFDMEDFDIEDFS